MTTKHWLILYGLTLVLVMGLTQAALGMAQSPGPVSSPMPMPHKPPCPSEGRCGTEGGHGPLQKSSEDLWFMPEGAHPPMETAGVSPQATGGPDDFGYTWDDSVPLNWIDASGGTDSGISSSIDHVGPIDIGFSFKHYENTYTQLYISRFGFVAFNDNNIYNSQSRIPSLEKPDDVIAPHWVPAYNVNGYVRYLSGGTAPNRWFAIEWNRLESDSYEDPDEFTFEVILHENSDVVFQYETMTIEGGWFCQSSGIEDSMGVDGLSITDFCEQIAPNHAVRIYRPAPSARVRVYPLHQGRFTHAGETVTFQVPIRNTGELGSDTYDLFVSSPWMTALYAADGTTPLTDTDSDGTVDTGSVIQGSTATITVKVTTPGGASLGDDNSAAIAVRSSLNTSKSKTVTLQTSVPAPFAQVFCDDADGAMSLYLVQPGVQAPKKATPDGYYGYYMAVAEMPSSFAYFWTKYHWTGSVGIYEIEYTLLDCYGETVRGVSKLTDHTGATVNTYDYDPAVAVAPNGRIGVVWYRYLYNSSDSTWNYNIYYAVLDASGNVVVPPTNLTNNPIWGYG